MDELNLDNLVKDTLEKIEKAVSHPLPDREYIERLENYATTLIGQYTNKTKIKLRILSGLKVNCNKSLG